MSDGIAVIDNGQTYETQETSIVAKEEADRAERWAKFAEEQANLASGQAIEAAEASDAAAQAATVTVENRDYIKNMLDNDGFRAVASDMLAEPSSIKTALENANNAAADAENAEESATIASQQAEDAQHWAEDSRVWAKEAERFADKVKGSVAAIEGRLGDIGFSAFGIDESLNTRRYLNGQVISQDKFKSFAEKIKEAIKLYPNIATTEENWQAEVTNSKLGQCGKFVIDDNAGTIRLPKVVNIQGLQDLSLLGGIKAESLPNIRGKFGYTYTSFQPGTPDGCFYSDGEEGANGNTTAGTAGSPKVGMSASLSSSTYQDNAPVQQEAVRYPYFIQVATGVEESVDVTREIELNNPFSLLDYKWSEYEITNASWLLSNGQFNSGATYISVYNLLLEIYNGTVAKDGVSVKLSTESFDDTDFVLNTADTTFRLPIKVKLASGNAVVGNGRAVGIQSATSQGVNQLLTVNINGGDVATAITSYGDAQTPLGITTDPTKSGIETSSSGLKLYFYVGETIQDANVIAASQVLTTLADCVRKSSATDRKIVVGWGMPDYSAGVAVSNDYVTTFPCFVIARQPNYSKSITAVTLSIDGVEILAQTVGNASDNKRFSVSCFVEAGHTLTYSGEGTVQMTVYPLKGVN